MSTPGDPSRPEDPESKGFTVWFTGLSGSGKTTIGKGVAEALKRRGFRVEFLDSGRIRQQLNRNLGFTREEIETNLLRLGYECKLLNRNGIITVVTAVSPYRDVRDRVRQNVGALIEVYCRCPIEMLFKRGAQELFERARRGEIDHVAGVNAPYEEPFKPEVLLNTDTQSTDECVKQVLKTLELLGYIPEHETSAYTPREEAIIKDRLKDLGYL